MTDCTNRVEAARYMPAPTRNATSSSTQSAAPFPSLPSTLPPPLPLELC